MNFFVFFIQTFSPLFAENITLISDLISIEFFSPFFAQIDCHTFYIALHLYMNFYMNLNAVPLKQWIWLYYLNFNAIPILQCLWLSLSPFSPTCTFTVQSNFPHIATNYCPMYFPMKIVLCNYLNLGKAVLRPPFQASLSGSTWHRVCLYLNLLLRWSHYRLDVYTLPLCQAFLCIASAGLFLCICLFKACFVMLSVGWLCSLVVL